jgi:hypothetical protein
VEQERVETCEHEQHVRGAIRAFVLQVLTLLLGVLWLIMVVTMLSQHSEHTWSGRAVARIFHGIQVPSPPLLCSFVPIASYLLVLAYYKKLLFYELSIKGKSQIRQLQTVCKEQSTCPLY